MESLPIRSSVQTIGGKPFEPGEVLQKSGGTLEQPEHGSMDAALVPMERTTQLKERSSLSPAASIRTRTRRGCYMRN